MRDLGLLDRLQARGLRVVEIDGWQTRGSSGFNPRGSVNHHTAGARRGNSPSLGICINGRADLPGPLCHVLQARDDTCYLIAAGRANHAGRGGWRGLAGNSSVYGLEVEHVGTVAEPYPRSRYETSVQIHAAFAEGPGFDASMVCQHHEWTTRKIDFVRALLDPDGFRTDIGRAISLPSGEDMTPEQAEQLQEVYDRLVIGAPTHGVPPMWDMQIETLTQLRGTFKGSGDNLREFIQKQDRRTRELTAEHFDRLWQQIEDLANEGTGGPINVTTADARRIAQAVWALPCESIPQ